MEIHVHIHNGEVKEGRKPRRRSRKGSAASTSSSKPKRRNPGAGLPKKYAKMGFKKGWREYKKTAAYKRKKKKGRR